MESEQHIFHDCIVATAQIAVITTVGFVLFRTKMIGPTQLKDLSKLVEYVFSPCLIFYNFVGIDLFNVYLWLPVLMLSTLVMLLGWTLGSAAKYGYLRDALCGNLVPLACALSHTTNIQLSLSESLAPLLEQLSSKSNFKSDLSANERAVSYVMIGTILATIIRWTVGKKILENPELSPTQVLSPINDRELPLIKRHTMFSHEDPQSEPLQTEDILEDAQLNVMSFRSFQQKPLTSLLPDTYIPRRGDMNETPGLPKFLTEENVSKKEDVNNKNFLDTVFRILTAINSHMNGPLWAALAALVVGVIPPLKDIFVADGTLLNVAVMKSCKILGRVLMPVVLLVLGGNLANANKKTGETLISWRTIITVTVIKQIIMPVLGIPVVFLLVKSGLLVDPVMMFICGVNFAMPPAINLIIQASQMGGDLAKEVSKLLFVGYISLVVTLPIVLALLLKQAFKLLENETVK